MGEILFKAKRIDNGEWIIGDGIHYPKSINYKGRCFIDGMNPVANDWIEIIPSTLCQYTGLKDKNGVKIFNHDIVKFDEKEWGSPYEEIVTYDYALLNMRTSDYQKFCEVIGNIHDEEQP